MEGLIFWNFTVILVRKKRKKTLHFKLSNGPVPVLVVF